jgi:phage pi2 protein 07
MFFGNQTQQTRQVFFDAWSKYQQKNPLSALEQDIVNVILDHPEYHKVMRQVDNVSQDYFPEMGQSNPFLHMGLHLAIREQLQTNRPQGIQTAFQSLMSRYDKLESEHLMMNCLAEALWQAQRANTLPDEQAYLESLRKLTRT